MTTGMLLESASSNVVIVDMSQQIRMMAAGLASSFEAEMIYQDPHNCAYFCKLRDNWKEETRHVGSVGRKVQHPAYLAIIAMGKPAVFWIIKDMKENGPNDWFHALTQITGVNPITEEISGYMQKMTDAWIDWYERNKDVC